MEGHKCRHARILFLCVLVAISLTEGKTVKFKFYSGSSTCKGTYTVNTVKYVPSNYFSSWKTTYFVIHGWKMNAGGMDAITRELVKRGEPVFVVDWSDWAKNLFYPVPCWNTVNVGKTVASFIRGLEARTSARRERMHVIGFSLGGKVSAATAASLGSRKLKRITGLDTPLYCSGIYKFPLAAYLDPSDATFVDTIRTSFLSGIKNQQQGHADFRTCLGAFCVIGSPSKLHNKAIHLFANSINRSSCQLKGRSCLKLIVSLCFGRSANMGFRATKPSRTTMYYVSRVPQHCKS